MDGAQKALIQIRPLFIVETEAQKLPADLTTAFLPER
jgi:hypothetical protein